MRNEALPVINNYVKEGVNFVEVTNNVGMTTTFTDLGGAIYSIKYLGDLMTTQAKNFEDFVKDNVYNGKAIGRVAGRIKGSTVTIEGKKYKLAPNEDGNVLHGGKFGLSTKIFSQRVFNTTEHVHVVYTYFSSHGECGFPGNALFEIHYIISNNKPKLKVKLLSYVTETCPVSMTAHTYFSLGEHNLEKTKLKINASKVLEVNPEDLIMGKAVDVPSYLDFRKAKPVLKDIANKNLNQGRLKGYDHAFIFDKVTEESPQVVMENDKYILNVFTDFDSVVIYSDNYPTDYPVDSSKEKIHRCLAIEPQLNPSKNRYLCRGEEFDHYIRYEIAKK